MFDYCMMSPKPIQPITINTNQQGAYIKFKFLLSSRLSDSETRQIFFTVRVDAYSRGETFTAFGSTLVRSRMGDAVQEPR